GNAVATTGGSAVVGAYLDDTTATDSGSAYVFSATTGALATTLNDPAGGGPGPNGSIRVQGNFIADMTGGSSSWLIGITIPPGPGGTTPIERFNVVDANGTINVIHADLRAVD